jgi:hypothetical protein
MQEQDLVAARDMTGRRESSKQCGAVRGQGPRGRGLAPSGDERDDHARRVQAELMDRRPATFRTVCVSAGASIDEPGNQEIADLQELSSG